MPGVQRKGVRRPRTVRKEGLSQPIQAARFPRVITTISLSRAAWLCLKRLAFDHAEANGGKPNNSAVLERLIRDASKRI